MTETLKIFGPPGTGKTRNLAAIFLQATEFYGTTGCAAVTYTRAAGQELKDRLAAVLKLGTHRDQIERALPYVGTIHSLCYRALGNPPMVDNKAFEAFCKDARIEAPTHMGWDAHVDDLDSLPSLDVRSEEAELLRALIGGARHRMITLDEMFRVWVEGLQGKDLETVDLFSLVRLETLAEKYTVWKRAHNVMDFEDLLEFGMGTAPPVGFLICDEVQDNSPLMWAVIDAWGTHCKQVVLAGDPFQSIYLFSGADPNLFIQHPGQECLLRESHRLTHESVQFARDLLGTGGWKKESDELGEWFGQEEPKYGDGSTFFLARTHRLLDPIKARLIEDGEPYLELRGTSPWQSQGGEAYRVLSSLIKGDAQPRYALGIVAKALRRRGKQPLPSRQMDDLIRDRSTDQIWENEARAAFGGAELPQLQERLPYFDYLHRVETKHGAQGLWLKPNISLGTIHASKGLEADTVNLVRSWAYRPAAALETETGRRGEACVAYVGATRHRIALNLIDADEGIDYDWPARSPRH